MIYIPIGIQCSVPDALKEAGVREKAYPFDYHFSPARFSLTIIRLLLNHDIDAARELMTTSRDRVTARLTTQEHHVTVADDENSECHINLKTGFGVVHHRVHDNQEFDDMMRRRILRLHEALTGTTPVTLIYADAASLATNYTLDGIDFGTDATDVLLEMAELVKERCHDVQIVYACWKDRHRDNPDAKITVWPFEQMSHWRDVKTHIAMKVLEMQKRI